MKRIWGICLIFLMASAGPVRSEGAADNAARGPVVVELFTNQNCAPCLPENQLLRKISHEKNLLPLTLPVSYLDIPGRNDTLASTGTANRQKAYANYRRNGSVCTPQLLINGRTEIIGNRAREAWRAISAALSHPQPTGVQVTFRQSRGGSYEVRLSEPEPAIRHHATIWLMSVERHSSVRVLRGENKGHLIKYANTVREIASLGSWHGELRMLHIPATAIHLYSDPALVVLVQENGYGPILAADYYIPRKH